MRFDIITLFPELFAPLMTSGITRRAYESGLVDVRLWNPRDHAEGNYRRVDDRSFGGGPGMVMLAEPLFKCLTAIRAERQEAHPAPLVLFSPIGQVLNHSVVESWSSSPGAVLLCGRYEGVDQRFIDKYVDRQISLGDFVLSGGEIAAMALLDAVARLQPGVLNDEGSHQQDSFNPALDGLLDSPHYTRPEVWQDSAVPTALMSGHHAQIARWRREESLRISALHRPQLLEQARLSGKLSRQDEAFLQQLEQGPSAVRSSADSKKL
ncbi:tRNA (guanosine(37)-N1)-methyltransferase TrmD [Limnohabitans sp. G3-2]|uniref:tRNA (guanosine(37)-N1)-methyltransferase TrmD n=1 Tax=Limnohabitans sp. G3-2 TaxID=1100711 RepID=UPI000C1E46F6|nr:tRNA (guanosine(37)-N1)-methyltransferase TrmD [Limnohabitans sp. G3-2]PIT72710.1 tRNA (guanosine(37)-N1)-methyltransferase TrmD [Limnohabitans sp. G3-2]